MLHADGWGMGSRLVAAVVTGVSLAAAFPPLGWSWLAPLALVPLLLSLRGARAREGALVGFVGGLVFYGILLYWISYFGYLAWVALVLSQAAAWAAFGAVAARLAADATILGRRLPSSSVRIVALWPLLWAAMELGRSRVPLGGFTWGGVGHSQATITPAAHLARVGGVYVVAAAVVLVAVLLTEALTRRGRAAWIALAAAFAVAVAPVWIPLGLAGRQTGTLEIAAVQGNAPRDRFTSLGRRGRVGPEDFVVRDNHVAATATLAADPPDLIVWPENSLDRDPRTNPDLFAPVVDVVGRVGAPLIAGAILDRGEGFSNSNVLVEVSGDIVDRYDKVHLVPFGEYVPWDWARSVVPALDQEVPTDGIPGDEVRPLEVVVGRRGPLPGTNTVSVGTVICFESIYPELTRTLSARGAEILVVTTNNASYGTSPAAAQHLAMSRLRAVENGRALVHAAITGMSAIVMPDGEVRQRAGLFTRAVLRDELPLTDGRTPYTRFGGWIESSIVAVALACVVLVLVMRRNA